MDALDKFICRLDRKKRERLLEVVRKLKDDPLRFPFIKLKGRDQFRYRTANFRILFHFENGRVIIDTVENRSEDTYK